MSAIVVVACAFLTSAPPVSAQTLPSGWTSANINSTGGGAINSSGTWTVTGSGSNIWDAVDSFHYTYRTISGDFEIAARLSHLDASNEWSKAGVMVRESAAANAKNAFVLLSPGAGPALQYRAATGGATERVTGNAAAAAMWFRLVRQGSQFTAYRSPDGSAWTRIGSATVSMNTSVLVGLAVTSRDATTTAMATFTNMGISASASAEAPAATWTSSDIGSPGMVGRLAMSSGIYEISGAGDIAGNADHFRYAYQAARGDVEIIARLDMLYAVDGWAKTGVMIRQSLDAGAPHGFMAQTRQNGFNFFRRLTSGGTTYNSPGTAYQGQSWLRLVREGNLLTAYESTNGTSWNVVGTETLPMSGTIYVGLAIASRSTQALAVATFTNVTIRTPTPGANQPPSVTLTGPSSGATFNAPATISLAASASDADGSISRVDFYRGSTLIASDPTSPYAASWSGAPAGTYALTAVAVDNEGASSTSPAVTVTVNGSTNQPPTVSFVSPSEGATFTAPASFVIQAAASDADGTISRVDLYQGSTMLKSDSTNPYSHRLNSVPAGTYQLTATARDNSGQTRTATMTVTVNPAGNQPPSVAISSPASGAAYTAPATISIAASASDTDGTIARVEFYRGTTLISTDTTSPYGASWTNVPAGSYALTARAYDNNGGSRTSTAVNVSVSTSANQLPTVSITSPTNASSFVAPATVSIAATATDADGTIAGVDFYVGTQLIGTDTTSPYTASWTNVAAGSYSLTARARDNAGASRTSVVVTVNVSATATSPTTLVFTASPDHSTLVSSYLVALYRSSDPVTASPAATRDLGRPTPSSGSISVDITTLVNPLPTGNYYAVVRAIGSSGSSASSPSLIFAK